MNPETTFACMRADHGVASELLHVSPVFLRCAPPRRGRHDEQRFARTLRTDARQQARSRGCELDSGVAAAGSVFLR